MTIVEEMRAAETESTPKSAKTITIRREPEPYSKTKVAFRAYYDDGSPMYLGAETLKECVERVRLDHPGHKIVLPDGKTARECGCAEDDSKCPHHSHPEEVPTIPVACEGGALVKGDHFIYQGDTRLTPSPRSTKSYPLKGRHGVVVDTYVSGGGHRMINVDFGKGLTLAMPAEGPYEKIEAKEVVAEIVAKEVGEPVAKETPAVAAAEKLPDCEPCLRVEKDVEKFAVCSARADKIGPLKTAKQVDTLVGPYLRRQDQEVFVLVITDVRFKYRGHAELHRGGRSRVDVAPDDVISAVTKFQGERVFIVHNHPSGDPSPSRQDRELTATIRKGLSGKGLESVVLVDHVIVGSATSYSLEENKSFKAARGA